MRKPFAMSLLVLALSAGAIAVATAAVPATAATSAAAAGAASGADAVPVQPVHPWRGRHHGPARSGRSGWRHAAFHRFRDLDLTASQRADIHRLTRASFEESAPEWRALRQKRTAFEQATPGTAEYVAARNDLAHAEANAALATVLRRSDLRTKIYAVLTPGQRTRLAEHEARWRARCEAWRVSGAKASS